MDMLLSVEKENVNPGPSDGKYCMLYLVQACSMFERGGCMGLSLQALCTPFFEVSLYHFEFVEELYPWKTLSI